MMAGHFDDENFWSDWCNPYDLLNENQLKLIRRGYKSCIEGKNLLEHRMIGRTPWGKMTLGERAERNPSVGRGKLFGHKSRYKKFCFQVGSI